jgi:hypothetical protein
VDGVLDDACQRIGEHGDGLGKRHAMLRAFDAAFLGSQVNRTVLV